MKRRMLMTGLVGMILLAVLVAPTAVLAQGGFGSGRGGTGGFRGGAGNVQGGLGRNPAGSADGTLDAQEEQALQMAIDDEYKALATYLGVMDQFGQVSPFSSIARAEQQHINALTRLFERYGLVVPGNSWIGNTPAFNSVADACAAGVAAEVENAALYDQLFSMVDNPDIVRVFTNLRDASEYQHLPAFSSCGEEGGGPGSPVDAPRNANRQPDGPRGRR